MSPAFSSLHNRNYRLFASGQIVSLTGTWMQRVAQDWLVLRLTHNSGVALGLTTALQFLPILLFGLYGGVIADRYDKRKLLIGTQVVSGLLALLLGILDVTGAVQLWQVYALAFGLGLASVVDSPARQAFVPEMVSRREVPNAVSLNGATFNAGRVLGPAVAGLLINAVGTGPVFLINAASFVAVIAGLSAMHEDELHRTAPQPRARGQLREGLTYVRERPQLMLPIVLVGVVGTFGLNFQLTTALMAKETFGRGAGSFGLLGTALAAGSLIGALLAARRGRPRQRVLLGAALAFGGLEILCGLMPTYWTFLALLVPTGVAVLTFTTAANSSVQLGSSDEMRGRVMALYLLVFMGGTPIGSPIVGWLAEQFGPRSSLLMGGTLSAAAALGVGWALARSQRLRVVPELGLHPRLRVRPMRMETGRRSA